jgi:hypothetical protein
MPDKTDPSKESGSKDSKRAPNPGERKAFTIAWAPSGPFLGFKKGEEVTLAIRSMPDQAIPVFREEAAVHNWVIAKRSDTGVFPDEQESVVFYVRSGTRAVIMRLKKFEIDSQSWTEAAKIRLSDGSKRAGWVSLGMIFNPRLEKLIEEWRSRSGEQ